MSPTEPQKHNREGEWEGEKRGRRRGEGADGEVNEALKMKVAKKAKYDVNNNRQQEQGGRKGHRKREQE